MTVLLRPSYIAAQKWKPSSHYSRDVFYRWSLISFFRILTIFPKVVFNVIKFCFICQCQSLFFIWLNDFLSHCLVHKVLAVYSFCFLDFRLKRSLFFSNMFFCRKRYLLKQEKWQVLSATFKHVLCVFAILMLCPKSNLVLLNLGC